MKINKILAAGIAATLAVTSVGAVVASAETKTFDMAKTQSERKIADVLTAYFRDTSGIAAHGGAEGADAVEEVPADVAAEKVALDGAYAALIAQEGFAAAITEGNPAYDEDLAALKTAADTAKAAYDATDKAKVLAYANAVIALAADDGVPAAAADLANAADAAADAVVAKVEAEWVDGQEAVPAVADKMIVNATTLKLTQSNTFTKWNIEGATLKVTGNKTGTNGTITTNTYKFVSKDGALVLDFLTEGINKDGQANLNIFDKITDVDLYVNLQEKCYTAADDKDHEGEWVEDPIHNNGKPWFTLTSVAKTEEGVDETVDKIIAELADSVVAGSWYNAAQTLKDLYAFLEKTTEKGTINRSAIKLLSSSHAYNAGSLVTTGNQTEQWNSDQQSYDDGHVGTAPFWFGGLASWVADFFNHQTNGKIIFNFTAKADSTSNWKNGGIPSTEVGLKSAVAGTNMGLFVNYNSSTGSLQSLGEVDGTSVIFDISQILKDMGGLTKGNVTDIYYGMNKGIDYQNTDYPSIHATNGVPDEDETWYTSTKDTWVDGQHLWTAVGYLVESVVLEYDENATDADTDTKQAADDVDDDDDDDDTDVTDDDDDDDDDADDADDDDDDDDDDASLDDDDDDDDDVANAEDINTPADDDANPGTGVALAVIPAIVAAAAAVVSKKRK